MNQATAPGPIHVEVVDLDGPVHTLPAPDGYGHAWLVGRRNGVPCGIVEVDLVAGASSLEEELRSLRDHAPAAAEALPPVPDRQLPRISVVVPTIVARTEELGSCLDGLAAVDYPDFEVVVVDNRRELPSVDPLPGLLAGRARVRAVRAERPGISAARNAGAAAASGAVVAFTDDDVRVDPGWLRAIGQRFVRQPELDAVTGLILPTELETPAQIYFERYYGGFSGERTFAPLTLSTSRGRLGRSRVVVSDVAGRLVGECALYGVGAYGAGANMAYRREALDRIGGFDLALGTGTPARGGEDLAALIGVLWSGGRIGYDPAAVVHHQHRRGYAELVHQLGGNGLGFTAMLTALVYADPAHLLALAVQLPLAARRLVVQSWTRIRGRRVADRAAGPPVGAAYPSELVRIELAGMPRGPRAYLRSRRAASAWTEGGAAGDAAPADVEAQVAGSGRDR